MKKIIILGCLILLLGSGERVTYACSCVAPKPFKLNVKKFKRWFNEYKGAIFVGRVNRVEEIEGAFYNLKTTFQVERNWKGGESGQVIVYSNKDGAACGIRFAEGDEIFLIVDAGSDGKLSTGLCDYIHYRTFEGAVRKVFGQGKKP